MPKTIYNFIKNDLYVFIFAKNDQIINGYFFTKIFV